MGRPKGTKLSKEQLKIMKEGREKARLEKLARGEPLRKSRKTAKSIGRAKIIVTGEERDAFDFWPALRNALRPRHEYMRCREIEKVIVGPTWQNVPITMDILKQYVDIEIVPPVKKRKVREKSTYVMTEEHKKKMKEAREAKKGSNEKA